MMSTVTVPLPADLSEFVKEQVRAGKFSTEAEALTALAQKQMRRDQQIAWLQREVRRGIDQADRGEFSDFTAADIIRRGHEQLAAKPEGK